MTHVTSLELSKRLKELGVKQESLFYWINFEENRPEVCYFRETNFTNTHKISAFLASELGEMLPYYIEYDSDKPGDQIYGQMEFAKCADGEWWICYFNGPTQKEKSMADTLGKMLIHLIEKDLVNVRKD